MRYSFVLTVAESKRLIAKGVAAMDEVQRALDSGMVAIAKGSTNSYVVEEILGRKIDKTKYMTGATFPAGGKASISGDIADVVLRDGQPVEGMTAVESVQEMKAGDVFMKGANALNYEAGVAGIQIGHPTGGTIGATIGTIIARRIIHVIPIGLEKEIPFDIVEAADVCAEDDDIRGYEPTLWPVYGTIVTEIEALDYLFDVEATAIGAGGLGGAEGSVRLTTFGTAGEISKVEEAISSIQGEPPFCG